MHSFFALILPLLWILSGEAWASGQSECVRDPRFNLHKVRGGWPFHAQTYKGHLVEEMRLLNFSQRQPFHSPDTLQDILEPNQWSSLRPKLDSKSEWDIVTNGTFCEGLDPLALFMRDGRVEHTGIRALWNRGGVAILENGDITLCDFFSASAPSAHKTFTSDRKKAADAIQAHCSRQGIPVRDFMGGGVTLIQDGRKIPDGELKKAQRTSFGDDENRAESHVFLATAGNNTYLILGSTVSARQAQEDFCRAGFENAVKFDGGRGFRVYRKDKGTHQRDYYPPCSALQMKLKRPQ